MTTPRKKRRRRTEHSQVHHSRHADGGPHEQPSSPPLALPPSTMAPRPAPHVTQESQEGECEAGRRDTAAGGE